MRRWAERVLAIFVLISGFGLLLALLFGAPARAQVLSPIYDVPCPAGESPIGQTVVPSTGHLRAWSCVDQNGVVTLVGSAAGTNLGNVVNATSSPFGVVADAGQVVDGSIANGSANLTSATAHWLTNGKIGQRIFAVESSGVNMGRLAFMGTITAINSDTNVTVSQTSNCSTANPCTGLTVTWGTGQKAAVNAWLAACVGANGGPASATATLPQICQPPNGGLLWEQNWFVQPNQTSVIIKPTAHTVLFSTPDFVFDSGGPQLGFANSQGAPPALYSVQDVEINGSGLTTTDGRTNIFNGGTGNNSLAANSECLFLSQGFYSNVQCNDWGDPGASNWQCATLDNYQRQYSFQCLDAGILTVQGSNDTAPVQIYGGKIETLNTGGGPSVTSPLETYGVQWQGDYPTFNDAGGDWHSTGDKFLGGFLQSLFVGAGNAWLTQCEAPGTTGKDTFAVMGTLYLSKCDVKAPSGQFAINTHSYGGTAYDDCTNTITSASDAIPTGRCGVWGVGTGIGTASSTLYLLGPAATTNALTNTTATTVSDVAEKSGTLRDLVCSAATGGVSSASGVVTVRAAALSSGTFSTTTLTATFGTGTTASDHTHTFSIAQGQPIQFQVTTQAGETLAGVVCYATIH